MYEYPFRPPSGATHFALSLFTGGAGPSPAVAFGLQYTNVRPFVTSVYHSYTAQARLYVNDLIIIWATLYKVTADVAADAALIPGTNITATTFAEQIRALQ